MSVFEGFKPNIVQLIQYVVYEHLSYFIAI